VDRAQPSYLYNESFNKIIAFTSLAPRRAEKNTAAAAPMNFGWRGARCFRLATAAEFGG